MVREIVAYATARGVRVLPELDLPGHSVGLQRGAPAVYANCSSPSKLPDPTTEDFFTFLESIVAEMGTLFPDNYIHMGGDEVSMIQIIQGQRFWRRNDIVLPSERPGRMIVCQDRLGSNTPTMHILDSEESAAALSLPFCSSSQVKTDCWTEDPAVVSWMEGRENGIFF